MPKDVPCCVCVALTDEDEDKLKSDCFDLMTPEGDGIWVCKECAIMYTIKEICDILDLWYE